LVHIHAMACRGVEVRHHLFLTFNLGGHHHHALATVTPGKEPPVPFGHWRQSRL